MYNQEQLGDLGLDLGIGEPAQPDSQPGGFLAADGVVGAEVPGGAGGGLLGGVGVAGGGLLGGDGNIGGGFLSDSLGDVPVVERKEDNMMPEIEDVIEDDNGGVSLAKQEENSVIF